MLDHSQEKISGRRVCHPYVFCGEAPCADTLEGDHHLFRVQSTGSVNIGAKDPLQAGQWMHVCHNAFLLELSENQIVLKDYDFPDAPSLSIDNLELWLDIGCPDPKAESSPKGTYRGTDRLSADIAFESGDSEVTRFQGRFTAVTDLARRSAENANQVRSTQTEPEDVPLGIYSRHSGEKIFEGMVRWRTDTSLCVFRHLRNAAELLGTPETVYRVHAYRGEEHITDRIRKKALILSQFVSSPSGTAISST